MKEVRKLLILGRVTHYRWQGQLYAYTPYAREIDVWAQLFPEVIIASILRDAPPPGDCAPFARQNIRVVPVLETGGDGFVAKLQQALLLPFLLWQLLRCLSQADAVHVRCPSDLGFLGIILGPLFSRRLVAKYATQWQPHANEPWPWRLQRALLKSCWWRGPVTVYGSWPNQPPQVVPFFTSMLTEEQVARARVAARVRQASNTLRVLFVGRLTAGKNADKLLQAIASAGRTERTLTCTLIGEGPERAALESLAAKLGIESRVTFTGGLTFDEVLGQYEQADILVLASKIEGWPKVVAEAMAFGLICIGSDRGMLPQMLGEGRGLLVKPGDVQELAAALRGIAENPSAYSQMAEKAAAWGQQYSLEGLREALCRLLEEYWNHAEDSIRPAVAEGPNITSR